MTRTSRDELTSQQLGRLAALFDQALDLPASERRRFAERMSADEPEVRHELLALLDLDRHQVSGPFRGDLAALAHTLREQAKDTTDHRRGRHREHGQQEHTWPGNDARAIPRVVPRQTGTNRDRSRLWAPTLAFVLGGLSGCLLGWVTGPAGTTPLALEPITALEVSERITGALGRGALEEAARLAEQAVDSERREHRAPHADTGRALANLASVRLAQQRPVDAEHVLSDALAIYAASAPADRVGEAIAQIKMGRTLLVQRRFAQALAASSNGLAMLAETPHDTGWTRTAAADIALAQRLMSSR